MLSRNLIVNPLQANSIPTGSYGAITGKAVVYLYTLAHQPMMVQVRFRVDMTPRSWSWIT